VYRKIFGFHKWEPVKHFIYDLGRLDFVHLRYFTLIKFCKLGMYYANNTISFLMKINYMSNSFKLICSAAGLTDADYCNLDVVTVGKIHYSICNKLHLGSF